MRRHRLALTATLALIASFAALGAAAASEGLVATEATADGGDHSSESDQHAPPPGAVTPTPTTTVPGHDGHHPGEAGTPAPVDDTGEAPHVEEAPASHTDDHGGGADSGEAGEDSHGSAEETERPRIAVLGGFAALNGGVLLSAAVVRRGDASAKRRSRRATRLSPSPSSEQSGSHVELDEGTPR